VHVVVGIDPAGDIWLLDLWRKQASVVVRSDPEVETVPVG
jgi:hypothetical protein